MVQLIQGKTAGVQITSASGEPGAPIALRIRGTSSVRSNNNPLFVVDGIPLAAGNVTSDGADVGFGSSSARNPLNFLNPEDIESLSILKDASATAIYGSRGANGVVIITTKTGRGKPKGVLEYTSTVSVAKPGNRFDLLDRNGYLRAVEQFGGDASAQDLGSNTDWQKVVTRTSFTNNHSLGYGRSYTGGDVRASFGYGEQLGVVKKSGLERITGRLNANHSFFKEKLKLSFQGTIARVNDEAPPITNNAGFQGDLLGAAYSANPTWPNDPNFNPGGANINPIGLLEFTQNETKTDRYLLNFSAEYFILPELSAKVSVGLDNSASETNNIVSGQVTGFNNGAPGNGRGVLSNIDANNQLLEATLNYEKEFGNSKLSAIAGFSYQEFARSGRVVQGFGYNSTNLDQMALDLQNSADIIEGSIAGSFQQYGVAPNGSFVNRLFPQIVQGDALSAPAIPVTSVLGDTFDFADELQSFFVRGIYTIADKYIFTGTVRADGSSKFGPNNRYGYFPSGAFAWKIDQEDFVGDSFSTLKLRLGYGITGNQDGLGFGEFTILRRFAGGGIGNGGDINPPGTTQVSFVNDDLKWEETTQTNIGLDFGFMDDRIRGTIDVYKKNTEGFLLNSLNAQPTPQPFNFGNIDGSIINQGIEFSINYDILRASDWGWDFGFNIAYNENEVQNYGGQIPTGQISGQGLTGAFAQLLAEGQSLFSYYVREFDRFDGTGQSIYPNGDVQEFVGKSALPDINLGISTGFNYKNWDASIFLAGQFGHYIYNNTANAFFTAGSINGGRNVTADVLTNGESSGNAPDVSTRFIEKGDFLRLQNLSIGYNVPLSSDKIVKTLRLFGTGQNLFVITDYSGLDPEVSTSAPLNDIPTSGIDYTAFPRPRTFTFGAKMTF